MKTKFNLGDWVISDEVHHDYRICQIIGIDDNKYYIESIEGYRGFNYFDVFDNLYHLWTIQDAKDGDVLAEHETIVLFKAIEGINIKCYCTYHYLGYNPTLYVDTLQNKEPYRPTAKKQRDRLFQKMKEAGYEWDAEKKELVKIEQNPAWGEEDEKMMNKCIEYASNIVPVKATKESGLFVDFKRIPDKKAQDWLKALKERYTWKPSDEQIKALNHVLLSYIGSWQPELQSLLNDLMKLKEL